MLLLTGRVEMKYSRNNNNNNNTRAPEMRWSEEKEEEGRTGTQPGVGRESQHATPEAAAAGLLCVVPLC